MKKIDKYLIKAFVGPFTAILLIVVFVLLLQFLWVYIDELVGKGLSFRVVLEFLGWGGATMLPLAIPLATVLASVMTLGQLAEKSELVALRGAGIPLGRTLAPLIIVNVVIVIGAFFASNNLVPMAYNNIFSLRDDIHKTKDEIRIPTQTFYDGIDGYILRVESNDKKTGMMKGVMVYNHTAGRGNISLAMSDSALLKMSADKSYLTFSMYHGISYEESNSQRGRDTTRQLQKTEFEQQEIIIPLENYNFHKSNDNKFSTQAKSMRLADLQHDKDTVFRALAEKYSSQLEQMSIEGSLAYRRQLDSAGLANIKAVLDPALLRKYDFTEDIAAHSRAIAKAQNLMATVESFNRDTIIQSQRINLIDLEIYKKFSGSIICLLLFFIGAPLGSLVRKKGLGGPGIVAVLFFILYYILDISGTKVARDGSMDPFLASILSLLVITPICVYFTYKAAIDESILQNDKLIKTFKNIRKTVMSRFHKTNIIYMGTPDFAVAPLKALLESGHNVVAVVTVPDKPSGRGLEMNQSAVKKFALEHNLPVLQPEKLKDPGFIEQLKAFKADMFVVVAFRLLPREVFSLPRLGTFNLHAALLPQYRGAAPINWAVINGEHYTGVTSFLIDDGVDTGTVLFRDRYEIKPEDTAGDVHDALMEMGSRVVVQTVDALIDNEISPRLQKSYIQGSEVLHKAPKLSRELCHIDWNDTTKHIVNLIRGLSDYPAAFTELQDENGKTSVMKIYRAVGATGDEACTLAGASAGSTAVDALPAPGTVVSDGKTFLGITTADGVVKLQTVQMAGKKRMGIEDFLRGFHNPTAYKTSQGTSKEVVAAVHESELA